MCHRPTPLGYSCRGQSTCPARGGGSASQSGALRRDAIGCPKEGDEGVLIARMLPEASECASD